MLRSHVALSQHGHRDSAVPAEGTHHGEASLFTRHRELVA